MLADKMACQWAGIEHAMNFANHNPAFRPQVESLVNTYFALIDEMAAGGEENAAGSTQPARLRSVVHAQRSLSAVPGERHLSAARRGDGDESASRLVSVVSMLLQISGSETLVCFLGTI
jgi:hypothetical protein